ncbi:MAG: cell division protein ZapA [Candidatus Binatia bacterium]
MPQPVEVVIMGQTFSVTSDDGEAHLREVAVYVDRTMREIATRGKVVSSFTAAVLAALNIASEWHKLRQNVADMDAAIERLAARLEAAGADGSGAGEEKAIRNG